MKSTLIPDWPRTAAPPLVAARLRANAEDFLVRERIPFELTGSGEHLWVLVRKRGWNTEDVAKWLARSAGISRRDVGYAGMKDRNAVTEQWFSLQLAGRPDPQWPERPDGVVILESRRHNRKLRTGALAGNCFVIVLRGCQGDPSLVERRVSEIGREGVPNYFGEQRFGRGGENIARAEGLFAGTERARSRHEHGIWLSAARALLFNDLLAARVRAGTWNRIFPGEACALNGSHSYFVIDQIDAELERRLVEHDIHPSGPLWGDGDSPSRGAVRDQELAVAAHWPTLAKGLADAGMKQERRPLRLVPEALSLEPSDEGVWTLRFCLPAGSYATTVVRELANYTSGELGDHP